MIGRDEWPLLAVLVGMCALGLVTAAMVGRMLGEAWALPWLV